MLIKLEHLVLAKLYLVSFERVSIDVFRSEVINGETYDGVYLIDFEAMDSTRRARNTQRLETLDVRILIDRAIDEETSGSIAILRFFPLSLFSNDLHMDDRQTCSDGSGAERGKLQVLRFDKEYFN